MIARAGWAASLALLGALLGCEREDRNFHEPAPGAPAITPVQLSATRRSSSPDLVVRGPGRSAWMLSEGQRLYAWFNCAGCHAAGGGGGMGPPLIDDEWIYGSSPADIFETIQEGRPDGMPSFRGRVSAGDTWKLVAYVRYLGKLTPVDTWPGRADDMEEANPEGEDDEPREQSEVPATRRRD